MTQLSIVIPAFNEVKKIKTTAAVLLTAARHRFDGGVEVVVVDDGSNDHTALAAEAGGARVIRLPHNQGKGAALRAGVESAEGALIVLTDADLAFSADQVMTVAEKAAATHALVVGNRRLHQSSDLGAPLSRRVGSRAINWMSGVLVDGDYTDMQCGLKGFETELGQRLFGLTTVSGFALDVELFAAAERLAVDIVEVPVEVQNGPDSSVRIIRDGIRFGADLARAALARRRGGPPIDLSTDASDWIDYRKGPRTRRRRLDRGQRTKARPISAKQTDG